MPDQDAAAAAGHADSKQRQWIVPTAFRLPTGEVVPDRAAMQEAMEELAPILTRVGGTVTVASRRVEVIPGIQTETTSIVVQWQAFSSLASGPDGQAAVSEIPQMQTAPQPPPSAPEAAPQA